ncbi:MAG: ligase-associated DNA damage response DEXH box helicase [Ferrovibrionaceae bacterium]
MLVPVRSVAPESSAKPLPHQIESWFAQRGWAPHPHQRAVIKAAGDGRSVLLIAPTGGGKTLAGFLPILADLIRRPGQGTRALYISPLKALAVDIARNLETPVAEMQLDISVETRTGDTSAAKRQRQRLKPPDILLTTPEQLALMLSYPDAARLFDDLGFVILDELHVFPNSKRGDLLALDLERLRTLRPDLQTIGLSATVAEPRDLLPWLGPEDRSTLVVGRAGAKPKVTILASDARVPWAGHLALYALPEVYAAIRQSRTALVFVNTRMQAELIFQELWKLNDDNLPIALHHGSLDVQARRKVEAAMGRNALRAVVCTATLDLGIDWGEVDLVVQIGAPKGIARTVQRIGRANHRLDEPSHALLVPSNRFEMLECLAAREAIAEGQLDASSPKPGALDVLCQHLLGMACSAPIEPEAIYAEVRRAPPYRALPREDFDKALAFVENGGYALRAYERFKRLRRTPEGLLTAAHPKVAQQYRMNIGTIVEAPMLKVRLGRGRVLGEVEEGFAEQLVPGDTFVFAGEVWRFEGIRDLSVIVARAPGADPRVPSYAGGKFPLTTELAERVRRMLADDRLHRRLPEQIREWLRLQTWRSVLPAADQLLVETFPRGKRQFLVAYPFEGRLAHQTLGMLLTRRMERAGLRPLGFVAGEYALAIWSLRPVPDLDGLFAEDMLGDDLEAWLAESNLLKRAFRNVAVIAGLIDRRRPGEEKTGRQVTFSTDLIYDVLRQHEPGHILMRATWGDAAATLLDLPRLGDLLRRIRGHILHHPLDRVSPLAVPILLDIGRESVPGVNVDDMLAEAAEDLIAEATRLI